jgi:isoleucyl-tRNA synthetase
MSKSTGNFLTLKDAVEKYGADATRVALADAGDAVEDTNLEETVANSTILRLYNLKQWCEEMMSTQVLRSGAEKTLWDELFDNEMDKLVRDAQLHYEEYVHLELCLNCCILSSSGRTTKPLFELLYTISWRRETSTAKLSWQRVLVCILLLCSDTWSSRPLSWHLSSPIGQIIFGPKSSRRLVLPLVH